ncbi:hypothetical protein LSH36_841g00010 [Paralvinella palmiformis]|uniref:Uncharacterized protein n=1 Tax=Paralvinella palmiformis TaxID=53620 RepID=A0AAD9MTD1_9ANNE|nr:hypothetical protein LSH36_841g00010 [Paralvinella palmiformis]
MFHSIYLFSALPLNEHYKQPMSKYSGLLSKTIAYLSEKNGHVIPKEQADINQIVADLESEFGYENLTIPIGDMSRDDGSAIFLSLYRAIIDWYLRNCPGVALAKLITGLLRYSAYDAYLEENNGLNTFKDMSSPMNDVRRSSHHSFLKEKRQTNTLSRRKRYGMEVDTEGIKDNLVAGLVGIVNELGFPDSDNLYWQMEEYIDFSTMDITLAEFIINFIYRIENLDYFTESEKCSEEPRDVLSDLRKRLYSAIWRLNSMSATDIYGLSPNEIQLSTQGANLNFFLELSELRSNFTRRLTDFAKHLDDSEIEGIKQMLATEMTYYTECFIGNPIQSDNGYEMHSEIDSVREIFDDYNDVLYGLLSKQIKEMLTVLFTKFIDEAAAEGINKNSFLDLLSDVGDNSALPLNEHYKQPMSKYSGLLSKTIAYLSEKNGHVIPKEQADINQIVADLEEEFGYENLTIPIGDMSRDDGSAIFLSLYRAIIDWYSRNCPGVALAKLITGLLRYSAYDAYLEENTGFNTFKDMSSPMNDVRRSLHHSFLKEKRQTNTLSRRKRYGMEVDTEGIKDNLVARLVGIVNELGFPDSDNLYWQMEEYIDSITMDITIAEIVVNIIYHVEGFDYFTETENCSGDQRVVFADLRKRLYSAIWRLNSMSDTALYGLSPNEIQSSTQEYHLRFFMELEKLRSNFTHRMTYFAEFLTNYNMDGIKDMLSTEMTYYTEYFLGNPIPSNDGYEIYYAENNSINKIVDDYDDLLYGKCSHPRTINYFQNRSGKCLPSSLRSRFIEEAAAEGIDTNSFTDILIKVLQQLYKEY